MDFVKQSEPMFADDSWVYKLAQLYSDEFAHDGVGHDGDPPGRGSGRYAWGTGERIFQRSFDIYSRFQKYRKAGMSEVDVAKALGFYKTDRHGNVIKDKNGEPVGNTALLRARAQIAKDYLRNAEERKIRELKETIDPDTGDLYTNQKIADMLGLKGESSVRNILKNTEASENSNKTQKAADDIKEAMKTVKYLDVGRGAELSLGVSPDRLKVALELLKEEGYEIKTVPVTQVGMKGEQTITKVLCPPGTDMSELYSNLSSIRSLENLNGPSSATLLGMRDPVRVEMSRIKIKYDEEGGSEKDGVIEIRARKDENGNLVPVADDLSIGNAKKYAQVRIAVEGDKYIKGMAVYNTDLPEGVDILVNSNKSVKDGVDKALKSMKDDTDAPFGTTVWQSEYAPGKQSAINVVSDIYGKDKHQEGSWDEWSRNLPAQFLSKQSEDLIKQQLKLKVQQKEQELEKIRSINNPVVKKQMLLDFAEGCDASAVDLKAAALPGQRVQVLLPVNSLKETQAYNPNYANGTTLALIRFPHTGPFEIPIVKVDNTNKEAKSFLKDASGEAKDVCGINYKTAQILSGADFDGDTVICIPMTRLNSQGEFDKTVNIKGIGNGQHRLQGLEGFNPSDAYPRREGMKVMDERTKQIEMGVVSNLITDMSLKGGVTDDHLERAVKYSMVVIDSVKHELDYTRAEKELNIKELKEIYQSNADGSHGTSTLISRAKSEVQVPQRERWNPDRKWIDPDTGKTVYAIDPETGEKNHKLKSDRFYEESVKVKKLAEPGYTWTDKEGKTHKSKYVKDEDGNDVFETYIDKNGREKIAYEKTGVTKERTIKSTKMAEAKNAYDLLSDDPSNKEILYAEFASKMKSMANETRKEYLTVPKLEYSSEARKKYAAEVASLDDKLIEAKKNSQRERDAQRIANDVIRAKKADNPNMSKEDERRLKGQALTSARDRVGAKKERVTFTEKEWEAINAGAISQHKLEDLLSNADKSNYTALATPRNSRVSAATAERVQNYLNKGFNRTQVAEVLGLSVDTVKDVEAGKFEHS